MANESVVFSVVSADAKHPADVTKVLTGGTLTGSNVMELKILKSAFTPNGSAVTTDALRVLQKKYLVKLALEAIEEALDKSDWPLE